MSVLHKCLIFLFFSICLNLSASTYYVSNNGSDSNAGTSISPWLTIQKGITAAISGDSLIIDEGSYSEKVIFPNSGTISDPIVIIGRGQVIVKGNLQMTVWSGVINIFNKTNITLQNIQVQDSYWFGFYIDNRSENIRIQKCSTYNTGASGIYAGRSVNITADSNIIRKACYQSLTEGSQECISFVSVNIFRIEGNEISESGGSTNGGEGIDTKEGCKNGIVKGNYVHDLDRLGIYADAWDNTCENIEIYNNRVNNCASGIAISSENGGTVRNIRIYNNLVYGSKLYGIVISSWEKNGSRRNITIFNNTCYKNGSGTWGGGIIIEENANADSIFIANNLCYDNYLWGISALLKFEKGIFNNLIFPYFGHSWTHEVKGSESVINDPFLVNPLISDFNLGKNSPAIGKGNSLFSPDFDFSQKLRSTCCTDIGAYQYFPRTTVGITKNNSEKFAWEAYLNPQNSDLIIKNMNEKETATVKIITVQGITILTKDNITKSTPVSLKTLSPGIYIVDVLSEHKKLSFRIVK